MRKVVLFLLGLLLILILSYFCYQDKSKKIKEEILFKVSSVFASEGVDTLSASLQGEGLWLTRRVILEGEVHTQAIKERVEAKIEKIEAISSIENLIVVRALKELKSMSSKRKLFKREKPYRVNIRKFKSGKIVLSGNVPTQEEHDFLLEKAERIYGKENVVDKLEEAEGAPKNWVKTISLSLDKLVLLDYGQINIKDEEFSFEGYINSKEQSIGMFKSLKETLPKNYVDEYNIKAPEEEFKEENQKLNADSNTTASYCQKALEAYLSQNSINFSYNKTTFKESSYERLNRVVEIIKRCPQSHIIIEGHTDTDGMQIYNQQLSEKRALAVKRYLVAQGINEDRLEAIGYGELKPLVENSTRALKKQNRRIEFKVKGVE